jgi:hypothetical protein
MILETNDSIPHLTTSVTLSYDIAAYALNYGLLSSILRVVLLLLCSRT